MSFPEYQPHPLLNGPHRMTIAAAYWPRRIRFAGRGTTTRRIEVAHGTELLVLVDEPPSGLGGRVESGGARGALGTLILVHGLTGSAASSYMLGTADKALAHGLRTVRVNLRGAGGTEALSPTFYHSGLSADLGRVVDAIATTFDGPLALAGFSLGGNLVMKLAGEWGAAAPARVAAMVAVSAPIDLAGCSDALDLPGWNSVYQRVFVRGLASALRRRGRAWPHTTNVSGLDAVRTVREFDDRFTAPAFGFRDAADYYRKCSASNVLSAVRVPSLLISARDDPFIPPAPYDSLMAAKSVTHPALTVLLPAHGGHLGFVASGQGHGRRAPGSTPQHRALISGRKAPDFEAAGALAGCGDDDRFWAENRVVQFSYVRLFALRGKQAHSGGASG